MSTRRILYPTIQPLSYLPGINLDIEVDKKLSYLLFFPTSLLQYFQTELIENATVKQAWTRYHINTNSITLEKVMLMKKLHFIFVDLEISFDIMGIFIFQLHCI
jgi:hypothetical protein